MKNSMKNIFTSHVSIKVQLPDCYCMFTSIYLLKTLKNLLDYLGYNIFSDIISTLGDHFSRNITLLFCHIFYRAKTVDGLVDFVCIIASCKIKCDFLYLLSTSVRYSCICLLYYSPQDFRLHCFIHFNAIHCYL